jgi:hypothetical protein
MAIIHDFNAIKAQQERLDVRADDDLRSELLRILESVPEAKQGAFMAAMRILGEAESMPGPAAEPENLVEPAEPAQPPYYLAALRERVAAIIAEFDVPLPEGDAGLAEADRRLHEMSRHYKALDREFEITLDLESDEIIPERDRVEERYHDALTDTEPQTLAGAATILRYLLGDYGNVLLNGADEPIANVLSSIERELAKGGVA